MTTQSGTILTDPAADPLIGQLVVSTNSPATGKLVDLDPDQQQVSQVWGMQFGIGDPASDWLVGDYKAAYFQQIFGRCPLKRLSATAVLLLVALRLAAAQGTIPFTIELGGVDGHPQSSHAQFSRRGTVGR